MSGHGRSLHVTNFIQFRSAVEVRLINKHPDFHIYNFSRKQTRIVQTTIEN